ncbi:MAG: hypothetical protein J7K84_11435 [Deltaproteobacteria bacterium]|nr:hypothetical protein [Deltaproteobacteria bacterium]
MTAFLIFFTFVIFPNYSISGYQPDYSRLVELIRLQDIEKPFYVFNNFVDEPEPECLKATLKYLTEHQTFIDKLRADLHSPTLRWEIKKMEHRLLFVPETRKEFVKLYESYCHDVLNFIFKKTNLKNPYKNILTLDHEVGSLFDNNLDPDGITACLVHNLAKEYNASCVFYSQGSSQVKVKIKGRIITGEVGSYTSDIFLHDDGSVEFIRNNYTIWQNSAENPYTALMVPVEETLHILLRESTENMIKKEILLNSITNIDDVIPVADGWLAIEEAVVGGIVNELLPSFLERHITNLPSSFIDEDLQLKNRFKKYKYLQKGICVVERIGYVEAINIYRNNTMAFKKMMVY